MPRVSVILPVYNGEPFLRTAIESVLSQSFSDFEVLALDDGSTDRTLEILRSYEGDSRLRIMSRENRGLTASLNELIDVAQGEYLARMDADDICEPKRFEKQVSFLDSNPDHVVVGGRVQLINQKGHPIQDVDISLTHEEIDKCNLRGKTAIWHPTALIRQSAVLEVARYHEEFSCAQDLDLWLRLGEIGKLANIPDVVLRYRLHNDSVSFKNEDLQLSSAQRACSEAWKRRGINGTYEAEIWRSQDKGSRYKLALEYGWIAWSNGYRQTWRSFAWEAALMQPFSRGTWRLIIFGFLKKPKHPPSRA